MPDPLFTFAFVNVPLEVTPAKTDPCANPPLSFALSVDTAHDSEVRVWKSYCVTVWQMLKRDNTCSLPCTGLSKTAFLDAVHWDMVDPIHHIPPQCWFHPCRIPLPAPF